jgi:methylase of polypeptide subunit release factors
MDSKSLALIDLGTTLQSYGYRFVAITPTTHRRALNRPAGQITLESIFGWNRPFERDALDPVIFDLLEKAEELEEENGQCKAGVRFATIGNLLFVHSGFPTAERDAVFFGPDTYRFTRALRASLVDIARDGPLRLIDIGSGSGAGGIFAARLLATRTELILADINRKALAFSAINAVLNDLPSTNTVFSDILDGIEGDADIILANPPYLVDEDRRLYRHGGGQLGISLALRIAEQSLARLVPGGRLILYSGTPIIGGADPFFESLDRLLQLYARQYSYEEIDPDVFGEELDKHAYANADRIAAVVLTAIKRG